MESDLTQKKHRKAYFLDTSTQIARHWHDPDTRQTIHQDLVGRSLRCSVYVEHQYKVLVLNAFISIHTLVENSSTLDEARNRLENRKDLVGDDLIYAIFRRFFNKYQRKEILARRLKKTIKSDWQRYFYDTVPRALCDLTGCTQSGDSPREHGKYFLAIDKRCYKDCRIAEFWLSKSDDLDALANIDLSGFSRVTDPKNTMSNIKQQAQEIANGASPYGDSCKKIMDDTIIAIEARDSYPGITVHSMDSDFELLSTPLSISVKVLRGPTRNI